MAEGSRLIILRGPSGSGKTTIAKKLQEVARSKTAVIEQDYFRRKILNEKDHADGVNRLLIKEAVLFLVNHGYNVILEGILASPNHPGLVKDIISHHSGPTFIYYLDIPFEETLKRHQTKINAHEFGEAEMRQWYKDKDLLGVEGEVIIDQHQSEQAIVDRILQETKI